jgi:hypothetical protein
MVFRIASEPKLTCFDMNQFKRNDLTYRVPIRYTQILGTDWVVRIGTGSTWLVAYACMLSSLRRYQRIGIESWLRPNGSYTPTSLRTCQKYPKEAKNVEKIAFHVNLSTTIDLAQRTSRHQPLKNNLHVLNISRNRTLQTSCPISCLAYQALGHQQNRSYTNEVYISQW